MKLTNYTSLNHFNIKFTCYFNFAQYRQTTEKILFFFFLSSPLGIITQWNSSAGDSSERQTQRNKADTN